MLQCFAYIQHCFYKPDLMAYPDMSGVGSLKLTYHQQSKVHLLISFMYLYQRKKINMSAFHVELL